MKWVKVSERLPEEMARRYFVKLKDNVRAVAALMWKDKKKGIKGFYKCDVADWNNYPVDSVSEWLDESPIKEDGEDDRLDKCCELLEDYFKFSSASESKAAFELIEFYRKRKTPNQ